MEHSALVAAGRAWDLFLDIIYPPRCGGCDRRGAWLCAGCLATITLAEPGDVPRLDALICAGVFTGTLRTAIHRLKYEGDRPLAKPLAELISGALERDGRWTDPAGEEPVVVPVPLHSSRRKQRGFNQSELLARELTRITRWPLSTRLVRTRSTSTQVGLHAADRVENVRDAFTWRPATPGVEAPPFVLLVDDVCTTGATLSECAFALQAAGTSRVCAVTVARAMGDSAGAGR